MSAQPFPSDLSFDRKHAKALLRLIKSGDAPAIARLRVVLPRKAAAPSGVTLADAQLVIARERGFESWPKLKAHVEAARPLADQAEQYLQAIRENKAGAAARILGRAPELRSYNIFTAAASGSAVDVSHWLRTDPALARATHGREQATALAYACGTRVHLGSADAAAAVRAAVSALLDAGADLARASVWFEAENRVAPIPALYYACISDHPALVELLLARGAATEDGESIYHAAQFDRRACLDILLAHGADLSSAQAPYGNTPLYFLAGHDSDEDGRALWFQGFEWLLDHGADPNVPSTPKQETPLHGLAASRPKLAAVRALLAHGADVTRRRADGRTAYAIAVRHGNHEIAGLLRQHGAAPEHAFALTPMEEFLGAALAADETAARAMLTAHPGLLSEASAEDRSALVDAARRGQADAVRLFVSLGFPLDAQQETGGTALHDAAWHGRVDMVRTLLALRAPLDVRDRQFGSSPIGWAAHGSGCHKGREDDYLAIVELLIEAGADRGAAINQWGEPPESMASARVAHRLTRWAALSASAAPTSTSNGPGPGAHG